MVLGLLLGVAFMCYMGYVCSREDMKELHANVKDIQRRQYRGDLTNNYHKCYFELICVYYTTQTITIMKMEQLFLRFFEYYTHFNEEYMSLTYYIGNQKHKVLVSKNVPNYGKNVVYINSLEGENVTGNILPYLGEDPKITPKIFGYKGLRICYLNSSENIMVRDIGEDECITLDGRKRE